MKTLAFTLSHYFFFLLHSLKISWHSQLQKVTSTLRKTTGKKVFSQGQWFTKTLIQTQKTIKVPFTRHEHEDCH